VFIVDLLLHGHKTSHVPQLIRSHRTLYFPSPIWFIMRHTNLSSTSSPMQTINHPLVTPLILTNHTPPFSSPYQSLALHVNVGSQLYTFPNPFDHAQLKHFPFPLYWSLHTTMTIPPNLPPFFQQAFNLHLKSCVPLVGTNLLIKG